MKNILFAAIFLFSSSGAFSQHLHFAKIFQSSGKAHLGMGYTDVLSIGLDAKKNIYSVGVISDTIDFDPGPGVQTLNGNYNEIYISKLDSVGNYVWVKQIEGPSVDESINILVNSDGSFFLSGHSGIGIDLDPGAGTYINIKRGFISKFDNQGNFVWAKEIDCFPGKIKGDAWGSIYITGDFSDTVDFDPGVGVSNLSSSGIEGLFILKLDTAGNFIWAKKFNSVFKHEFSSFIIDDQANLYLTGYFTGQFDADPDTGTSYLFPQTSHDVFIIKLDSSGALSWAKSIATIPNGTCGVDVNGNVYLSGIFSGVVDFDPGSSVYTVTSSGSLYDAYYLKLNSGGDFVWVKTVSSARVTDMNVDRTGTITSSGTFSSIVDFNPDPALNTSLDAALGNSFLHKIDSSGSLVWVRQFGLSGYPYVRHIALDNYQNVYVTGIGSGTANWDPGLSNYSTTLSSKSPFVTKYSSSPTPILNVNEQKTRTLVTYPNPTNHVLYLQADKSINKTDVHLYNVSGIDLISAIYINGGKEKLMLDLSAIPSGIYTLCVGAHRSVIIKH